MLTMTMHYFTSQKGEYSVTPREQGSAHMAREGHPCMIVLEHDTADGARPCTDGRAERAGAVREKAWAGETSLGPHRAIFLYL